MALKRSKWLIIMNVFILYIVFCVLFSTVQVSAATMFEESLLGKYTGQQNYEMYSIFNYSLDTYIDTGWDWLPWKWDDGLTNKILIYLAFFVNILYIIFAFIQQFVGVFLNEAFTFNAISAMSDKAVEFVQKLAGVNSSGLTNDGIFPQLILFTTACLGVYLVWKIFIQNEVTTGVSNFVTSLLVFVFSVGFFMNAREVFNMVVNLTNSLENMIITLVSNFITNDSGTGIDGIRALHFDLNVVQPWKMLEFGTTNVDLNNVSGILTYSPLSEDRQNFVKGIANSYDMLGVDGIIPRVMFLPILAFISIPNSIVLLLLIGSKVLYQYMFLILFMMAPFFLIFGMIPWTRSIAKKYLVKTGGILASKVGISLLIIIIFVLSTFVNSISYAGNIGYIFSLFLQIVIYVGIFMKRKYIMSIFSIEKNPVMKNRSSIVSKIRKTTSTVSSVMMMKRMGASLTQAKNVGENGTNNSRIERKNPNNSQKADTPKNENGGRKERQNPKINKNGETWDKKSKSWVKKDEKGNIISRRKPQTGETPKIHKGTGETWDKDTNTWVKKNKEGKIISRRTPNQKPDWNNEGKYNVDGHKQTIKPRVHKGTGETWDKDSESWIKKNNEGQIVSRRLPSQVPDWNNDGTYATIPKSEYKKIFKNEQVSQTFEGSKNNASNMHSVRETHVKEVEKVSSEPKPQVPLYDWVNERKWDTKNRTWVKNEKDKKGDKS